LAIGCLRALHLNGNRALRNVFCLRNFIAFIAFLAFFFLRKTLRTLRAFEWKPGFTYFGADRVIRDVTHSSL